MQNVVARWRRVVELGDASSDDFTIVVPLYGSPRYFQNKRALRRLKPHVVLAVATDVPEMLRFARRMERYGWRVHYCRRGSAPALVREALESVHTAWVIRLDGDSTFVDKPGRIVAAAEAANADLCSVKVVPRKRTTILQKLQGVEYDMAMLSRHVRPWLTSGACFVGRTAALRTILDRHSLWFCGEDIETGVVARRLGLRVVHVVARVRTDVPETLRALVRQRRSWWAGSFRHTWINFDHGFHDPVGVVYAAGLTWLLATGKLVSTVTDFRLVPLVVLVYTAVSLVGNWNLRSRWFVAYPYYALAQATVMPALGAATYVRLALRTRSLGRFRVAIRARSA